jgi:hypothetical protein
MGFLPFVNQCGQTIVRWRRLVLAWIAVVLATLVGTCMMDYVLVGDWRRGVFLGLAMGVAYSIVVTVLGLTTPVDSLPPIQPKFLSRGCNGNPEE